MESFIHFGCSREDTSHGKFVIVLDGPDGSRREQAKKIMGPDNFLYMAMNISPTVAVPADLKGRLLTEQELYARVPELDPSYRAPRKRKKRLSPDGGT